MSGHSNFEESGEGPGIGSSLFSLFCYSAILLFCYSAARRCLRCQPLRLAAGAVTWCAYHATSTHVQHTPHHNVRGEGPGTGRRCLGFAAARIHWALHAAFAAVDVRAAAYVAFRCFSHASYMARGERVRHRLLPSSHKVCAALRNAVAASRPLRTSLGSWR